uniref:Uncharacterized protein n=1 Tax=Ciona savignyi TaxID=51511 RepID=H2YSM3_CIOSA
MSFMSARSQFMDDNSNVVDCCFTKQTPRVREVIEQKCYTTLENTGLLQKASENISKADSSQSTKGNSMHAMQTNNGPMRETVKPLCNSAYEQERDTVQQSQVDLTGKWNLANNEKDSFNHELNTHETVSTTLRSQISSENEHIEWTCTDNNSQLDQLRRKRSCEIGSDQEISKRQKQNHAN